MEKINSDTELRAAIVALEQKQIAEAVLMRAQFEVAYESVQPINLIKSTIKEVSASQDIKDHLLNTAVGITAGYITKKIVVGEGNNPTRQLLGSALMFGVTNVITNNPEMVRAASSTAFRFIAGALREMKSKE